MPCSVKINRRRRIYAAPFATLLRCRLWSLAFDAQRLGHVGDGAVYVPLGRCVELHLGVLNLWLNEQVDEYGTLCGQGFVNASVLDQYDRSLAAYPESGDDGHGLAFAADRDQIQCWLIGQKMVHEVGFAIWKPDNVAELFFLQLRHYLGWVEDDILCGHWSSLPEKSRWGLPVRTENRFRQVL
jgi:hypothetical protein